MVVILAGVLVGSRHAPKVAGVVVILAGVLVVGSRQAPKGAGGLCLGLRSMGATNEASANDDAAQP